MYGRFDKLIADCGYDSNAIRTAIQAQGAEVAIPATRSRKATIPYDCVLIEPAVFGAAKDWRRIATPYDKPAANLYGWRSLLPLSPSGAIESGA